MNPDNPFSSGPGKAAPKSPEPGLTSEPEPDLDPEKVIEPEPTLEPEPTPEDTVGPTDISETDTEVVEPAVPVVAAVRPVTASASGDLPPLEMDETSCRTCQFCHFEGESRSASIEGECRYNAPSPGLNERATWPIVDWNSWCGQWNSGISNDDMVKMARVVADRMTDRGSFIQ